jgi:phospholipid/cholesterol/gamma-HCH transport system permease protein
MSVNILANIGSLGIKTTKSFSDTISCAGKVTFRVFKLRTYNIAIRMRSLTRFTSLITNSADSYLRTNSLGTTARWYYFLTFTTVELNRLPGVVFDGLIITELSPFTVLFITSRSSSVINTAMAMMKVDGEINTLETFRIDVINYL